MVNSFKTPKSQIGKNNNNNVSSNNGPEFDSEMDTESTIEVDPKEEERRK